MGIFLIYKKEREENKVDCNNMQKSDIKEDDRDRGNPQFAIKRRVVSGCSRAAEQTLSFKIRPRVQYFIIRKGDRPLPLPSHPASPPRTPSPDPKSLSALDMGGNGTD